MGHMLHTVNPDAAAAIGQGTESPLHDVPKVGHTVTFFPRVGEHRAGGDRFAALVTRRHEDGTLDLVVIYDADDFIGQKRVRRRQNDEGMGWQPISVNAGTDDSASRDIADLKAAFEAFKTEFAQVLFGSFIKPNESFVAIMADFEDRLEKVEKTEKTEPKKARGWPKGKPRKPKDQEAA